jgi:hypothetical protein
MLRVCAGHQKYTGRIVADAMNNLGFRVGKGRMNVAFINFLVGDFDGTPSAPQPYIIYVLFIGRAENAD